MKKILFFAAAVAALLTSCQKEKGYDDSSAKVVKTITASIGNSTKVVMGTDDGTDTKLNWEIGDNLLTINMSDMSTSKYSAENAGETASFSLADESEGLNPESAHFAVYPYENMHFGQEWLGLKFTFSGNQNYTANSFDKSAMPLLATNGVGETNFTFDAMAPVLRLKVKLATAISDVKVNSVVIESAHNNLAGTSAPANDLGGFIEPDPEYGDVSKSITLDCSDDEGVAINNTAATQLCIVLPGNEYPSGDLTITIKTNKGDIVKTSKADATFEAGEVYNINITADPVKSIPIVGSLSHLGPVKETIVSGSDLDNPDPLVTDSFCAPFDVEVPAGTQAFAMFYDAENNVIHSVYTGSPIPASMPVITVSGSELSEDDVNLADVPSTWTNVLVGNLSQTTIVQNNYVLAVKNGVVGFYKVDSYELGLFKAYMVLP